MHRRSMPLPVRALLLAAALLACAVVAPSRAHAQTDTATVVVGDSIREVRLADGSVLFGRIVSVEGSRVVIETTAGARVEVDRAQIRSVRPVRGQVRAGEVWPEDPHATRLFFAPTGRNLEAGEGYFGVYELFFPFVTYGVTDRFTISGGMPVIPGAIGRVAYVAPKLQVVDAPKLDVGVGVLAVLATYDDFGSAGVVYGVATYGDRDNAYTVGAGIPFIAAEGESEWADRPLLMVGAEARLSRRLKFLSENYVFPGESIALVSGGLRFFGERLSADFGLGFGIGDGCEECYFPLVNFVYSFGEPKK